MRLIFIILLSLVISVALKSQEKLGIVNSNYHPVSSIHLNASSTVDSRTYMQLNLVGFNAFAMTNAAYLPKFNFWNFVFTQQIPPPKAADGKLKKYLFVNAVLDGPTFTYSKKNFGFGLFVRARSVADVRRLPYQFADLFLNAGTVDPLTAGEIDIKNAKFSNMTWAEYGGNFGVMVYKRKKDLITAGVTLKYLTGINLQYLNFANVQGGYVQNGISITELDGRYRASELAWNSGRGFGMEAGVTYKKMLSHVDSYNAHSKSSKCKYIDYKYKIGVSLRDVGYIRFNKNTTKADLGGTGSLLVDAEGGGQTSFQDNFSLNIEEGATIRASLPTALSGQLDYNFENSIYLNLTVNKNMVPNRATGVQSSDLISIAPRFETRNFEASLPVTLQHFIHPQVGFAFRVRSLVVGFDNVLPLVMKTNTYGVGVYFNLAISLFRNPACGATGKIDDCGHYKNPKRKIKHKSTLISQRPRKK